MLTDDSVVKGFWGGNDHESTVFGKNSKILKKGAVWSDNKKNSGISGMVDHPQFHGYFKKRLYQCLYTANKGGIETI